MKKGELSKLKINNKSEIITEQKEKGQHEKVDKGEENKVRPCHSDSLDTLLYVRFAIQNLEFYKWKLGDHGWALSWHRRLRTRFLHCDLTWPRASRTKKQKAKKSSLSWVKSVSKICNSIGEFTIPLEYVSLWEGFSEHCGLSPLRGPSPWAISGLQQSSVRGEWRSVG